MYQVNISSKQIFTVQRLLVADINNLLMTIAHVRNFYGQHHNQAQLMILNAQIELLNKLILETGLSPLSVEGLNALLEQADRLTRAG